MIRWLVDVLYRLHEWFLSWDAIDADTRLVIGLLFGRREAI